MNYIGKNIRRLRQNKGWSQSQVAAQLKISVPAFSKIETGITDINISRLIQIAALFNVPTTGILAEDTGSPDIAKTNELNDIKAKLHDRDEEVNELQKRLINMYEEIRKR
ncbi:helix-turn-helix transcriptional regulator [Pedobacter sp. CG_S7]|uniref:helix-turn-helix domain-containing protein n=1 Tax=Pedobacter sp. CG_S7 TaxID=3143930 RepID=UPI0033955248